MILFQLINDYSAPTLAYAKDMNDLSWSGDYEAGCSRKKGS